MAPDWILLLWRPRTPATLRNSATTFQEESDGLQSIGSHRVRHNGNDLALTHVVLIQLLLFDYWKFMIRFHRTKMLDCQGKESLCKRTDLWLPRGRVGVGGWTGNLQMQTIIHRMKKQQGPACSTGEYVKYPVIHHIEKNMKKNVDVCITGSLCCTAKMNTTL